MEIKRMEALRRYRILDTPPEAAFDNITALAARLLSVPVALTTFVDANRVWFKARHGIELPQMQREDGLCATAILEEGTYVVEDASSDPRTRSHSWVTGEFGLRFYAAVPFSTPDGHRLGTLCVMDEIPRRVTEADMEILRNLAGLLMDQMELRRVSQELVEKNALLSKTVHEKDQLLVNAIHDLRTPLSTVTMLGSLLAEPQTGDLNPHQTKMVSSICGACKEMAVQLADFAEFVALDPDRIQLEKFATDVTSLVEDCIGEYRIRMADRGVFLRLEARTVFPQMKIDALRFRRTVATLINNAILRSEAGDTVVVEMRMEGRDLVIEVKDRGPAPSAEEDELLFNPSSGKRARHAAGAKDTGLALPVARRIVEAHGGRVGVAGKSEAGCGFQIRLPCEHDE